MNVANNEVSSTRNCMHYVFCFYPGAHTTAVINLRTIVFSGTMQVAASLLEQAINIFYNLASTVLSMSVTMKIHNS